MRVFSAIPFPESAKKIAGELTQNRLPVPYVNTNNLHITLNFFGDLDTDQGMKLGEIFKTPINGKKRFTVTFDKVVRFRNQIHLLPKPNPDLASLQADMQSFYREKGFQFQEREYYAHAKLATLHMDKVMHPERKIENFPNEELSKLEFVAEKVILFESRLLLHHAKHIPLMEIDLI